MALFQQSDKAVSAAVAEIADTAGASADSEQLARSWKSLRAAFQHFNNRANWNFVLTEATPANVVAPFGFNVVSASANQTSALVSAGHGLLVDDVILGGFFVLGARVSATAAANIGLSVAIPASLGTATAAFVATGIRDMYAVPTDWKAEYSLRLLGSQRVLRSTTHRAYGRMIASETNTSTPVGYDEFPIGLKGKIRLVRPPAAADVLQIRYYRRMDVPSASGVTAALDIPNDYEPYLISWAKWHFLTDKANAKADQATVWIALANEGMKTMLADQTRRPDEDLTMAPGHAMGEYNLNTVELINWDFV